MSSLVIILIYPISAALISGIYWYVLRYKDKNRRTTKLPKLPKFGDVYTRNITCGKLFMYIKTEGDKHYFKCTRSDFSLGELKLDFVSTLIKNVEKHLDKYIDLPEFERFKIYYELLFRDEPIEAIDNFRLSRLERIFSLYEYIEETPSVSELSAIKEYEVQMWNLILSKGN